MPGTRYGRVPFFSPDGRWVGFFAESQLQKALVSGGAPTTVSTAGGSLAGTWGEDDTIACVTGDQGGLVRVPAAGGEPETILPPDSGIRLVLWPRFLPGSRGILFTYTGRAGERWFEELKRFVPAN
jgi:serine/threonine-protein kinase